MLGHAVSIHAIVSNIFKYADFFEYISKNLLSQHDLIPSIDIGYSWIPTAEAIHHHKYSYVFNTFFLTQFLQKQGS